MEHKHAMSVVSHPGVGVAFEEDAEIFKRCFLEAEVARAHETEAAIPAAPGVSQPSSSTALAVFRGRSDAGTAGENQDGEVADDDEAPSKRARTSPIVESYVNEVEQKYQLLGNAEWKELPHDKKIEGLLRRLRNTHQELLTQGNADSALECEELVKSVCALVSWGIQHKRVDPKLGKDSYKVVHQLFGPMKDLFDHCDKYNARAHHSMRRLYFEAELVNTLKENNYEYAHDLMDIDSCANRIKTDAAVADADIIAAIEIVVPIAERLLAEALMKISRDPKKFSTTIVHFIKMVRVGSKMFPDMPNLGQCQFDTKRRATLLKPQASSLAMLSHVVQPEEDSPALWPSEIRRHLALVLEEPHTKIGAGVNGAYPGALQFVSKVREHLTKTANDEAIEELVKEVLSQIAALMGSDTTGTIKGFKETSVVVSGWLLKFAELLARVTVGWEGIRDDLLRIFQHMITFFRSADQVMWAELRDAVTRPYAQVTELFLAKTFEPGNYSREASAG